MPLICRRHQATYSYRPAAVRQPLPAASRPAAAAEGATATRGLRPPTRCRITNGASHSTTISATISTRPLSLHHIICIHHNHQVCQVIWGHPAPDQVQPRHQTARQQLHSRRHPWTPVQQFRQRQQQRRQRWEWGCQAQGKEAQRLTGPSAACDPRRRCDPVY